MSMSMKQPLQQVVTSSGAAFFTFTTHFRKERKPETRLILLKVFVSKQND